MTLHHIRLLARSKVLLRHGLVVAALAFSIGATLARGVNTYVYVESNIGKTAGNNSIFAFSNDGLGNMTALAGSPYLTGGTGIFDPGGPQTEFDADQQVIATPDNTLLYAVNGRTNTIAAFDINADGTLTTVAGSPFASEGQDPASLGFLPGPGTGLEFWWWRTRTKQPDGPPWTRDLWSSCHPQLTAKGRVIRQIAADVLSGMRASSLRDGFQCLLRDYDLWYHQDRRPLADRLRYSAHDGRPLPR
jgi:hypothetical protein